MTNKLNLRPARALALALGLTALLNDATAANAAPYELTIDPVTVTSGGESRAAIGYNGQIPGPTLYLKEGDEAVIAVTNNLDESSSVHWHGIILPSDQDGVPGISFPGIAPGETFTYRFPVKQSGTYWFHSHSGLQEQEGAYGSIVIEPKTPDPFHYDRDYVVVLSDRHPDKATTILSNLKKSADYYNRQQRTLLDFLKDSREKGTAATLADRLAWGEMRMTPTDIADVQGYDLLINGQTAEQNWTADFNPGERLRLRLINASAMTYFDVRIPGLQMTVVQADGNNVEPVTVDELRIAVAETYDVLVEPKEETAYSLLAESMSRSGMTRATLAAGGSSSSTVPEGREPPLLTMADMGMSIDHGGMMQHGTAPKSDDGAMKMDHGGMMQHGMAPNSDDGAMKMNHGSMMQHGMAPKSDGGAMKMDHGGMMQHGMAPKSDDGAMKMDHGGMMQHGTAPKSNGGTLKMDHGSMMQHGMAPKSDDGAMKMDHGGMMQHGMAPKSDGSTMKMDHGGMMKHGALPEASVSAEVDPFYAPGSGLVPTTFVEGGRFLSYADLKAVTPLYEKREPVREIEIRLTGNMERYFWSMNGVKYSDADPIRLQYGERVRFKFVNETMMTHPMHLHGMWMILDSGKGAQNPAKHTISIAPGTTVYAETEVDAPGQWAFHCHLLYHMATGMFNKVIVEGGPQAALPGGEVKG
ncbi:copper resistance system multicopper oxidase [Limibacillus halophilus]|uniref:CopA family copper-resistance protein n=1 Tax=Limibacillus halophilus TaxID=1579333 RepID=A0A839SS63_9PROT|nr:copper resistance system multicopper oxidase [Limibacillus halophilus]MBB3065158.1 CopA family copper-resistance protein [Limibacillus halophilus]